MAERARSPGRWRSRSRLAVITAGTAVLLALGIWGARRQGPAQRSDPAHLVDPAASAHLAQNPPEFPQRADTERYAGSAACQPCHEDEHASWHRSFHRTMTQRASASAVQADFTVGALTPDGRFLVDRTTDAFFATSPGPDGPLRRRVTMVTGSHHMQVFWLEPDDDGRLESFAFAFLLPEQRWVPNAATLLRPPSRDPADDVFTWNRVCIKCHAVAGNPGYDAQTDVARTTVAELGIACEACHGPGSEHIEAQGRQGPGDAVLAAATPPHPGTQSHPASSEICGQCHSITVFSDEDAWIREGHAHAPAQPLSSWARVVQHPLVDDSPDLDRLLDSDPDFIGDRFWPDGSVRVSGREYNAIVASPCFAGGEFGCLSCHQMHGPEAVDGGPWSDDQLLPGARASSACGECHASVAAAGELHTHHPPDSEGSNCMNCHMPRTTYGLLKAIPSHQIDSPNVDAAVSFGRPNACNLCHLDRTLAWTADRLAQWYGMPRQEAHERGGDQGRDEELGAGLRWMLQGDAGQRALAAWHAGYAPAQQASGRAWLVPALARLLADDYAAVRLVAERSLRTMPGLDAGVFVGGAAQAEAAVLAWWRTRGDGSVRSEVGLLGPGREDARLLDALFESRDRNRVSLAE